MLRSTLYKVPLLGKLIRILEERSSELISYGVDNQLPKEVMEGIAASGTAAECISLISEFIEADGFSDENFKKQVANPKQNWGDLLSEMAGDLAMFEGTYINVQYNAQGEPQNFYILPFDEIRRGQDGFFYRKVVTAKDQQGWADKSLNKATKYPCYQPSQDKTEVLAMVAQQMKDNDQKQLGSIHFIYRKKVYPKHYPIGDFYSGWEDIETDAALQRLERRNVKKGFKADVIISTLGEIDDKEEDDDGKTDYDYFKENLKKFTGEEGSSILHLFGKTGDTLPSVTPFPLKDLLNGIDLARKRVAKVVCRHFKCPPILILGEENYGWGDTKALVNSMKLFNKRILRYQNMITDGIQKLFPGVKVSSEISKLNIADYIDPAIKDFLLSKEIDAEQKIEIMIHVFGIAEDIAKKLVYGPTGKPKEVTTTEQQKTVDALNSLSPLLATKVLEAMDEDEIRGLVGLGAKVKKDETGGGGVPA